MASPAHDLTLEVSGGLSITGSNITIPPDGQTVNSIAYDELNPVFDKVVVGGLKSDEGLDKFFTNEINGALEVGGLIVCGSATFNQLELDKPHIVSSSIKLVDGVLQGVTEQAKLQIEGLGTMTTGSAETIIDLGDGFE
tara:strand:- start:508 stop:924 length:417 start_codon:yes stop_codon:yes gene_type:complete